LPILLSFLLLAGAPLPGRAQTVTVRIAQSSDDAVEYSSTAMELAKQDLWMDLYQGRTIGLRFPGLTIPRGATISAATVQFHVESVQANVALTLTLKGEDADDSATFTTTSGNITARPETAASVNWAIPHWAATHDEGAAQLSADLATIVQEIVDRGGWDSGNALAVLLTSVSGSGLRDAETYDSENGSAAEISITYTTSPYRSKGTGNWSAPGTWERYNGSSWVDATAYPDGSSAEAITVQSGHTVTVDSGVGSSVSVDQMTIDSGGTVVVDQAVSVAAGSGTDLTVAGQLTVNTNKLLSLPATSSLVVSSGGQITNGGSFSVSGTSTVTFTSGATYDHAVNGRNFPAAAGTTWSSGSTAKVTAVTTTLPTQLGANFHHFIWNSASQTAALDLAAAITAIGGDLTVTSTGSGSLAWGSGNDLAVGGNYVQTGGSFIFSDAGGTLSATDVTVTGGTLNLSTGASIATLDVDGDLEVSGGGAVTETGSSTASLKFTGTSTQSVTAASGLSGQIDIQVANTGGIQLLSDLVDPRQVTGTTGTIDLNNFDLTLNGALTINSDVSNPATITFDGSATATLSYASGTLSLPTLVVDKASGVFTLATDLAITTTVSVLNGTLDVNGQTFTFPTGTTLYNAGTVTGNVVFERSYALVGDGWRMIATPLDGVNYSSLNANFHTQGATWADFADGTATLQSADFGAQGWTEITGADASFGAGEGYIFYMYDTVLGSTILPATWSVTGTVRTAANRALSWNTVSTDSYNHVGNRTTSNIDWDAAVAASTNVATTYSTWDPALTPGGGLTGYKYYNSATGLGLAGRYIPPFTAFMVEPTATAGTLVFSTSESANLASANYFGKRESASPPHIRLMVEGQGHAELETYLVFDPEAMDGPDAFDGNRMRPISSEYVTMVSMQDDRTLVYDARSMEKGGVQEYTLGISATQPGLYSLTWPGWHEIPEGWTVTLHDRDDGRQMDLREGEFFTFSVREAHTAASAKGGMATIDARPRFSLRISDGAGDVPPSPEALPDQLVLAQNYPNPFNPVTSIRFALPEAAAVRLEVFDVLGRRVALLADGKRGAGWHEARWDASGVPSGLYLYRLSVAGNGMIAGTMSLTR
jgi:hypothetical protein